MVADLTDPKLDNRERLIVTNVLSPSNLFGDCVKLRVVPIDRSTAQALAKGKRAIVLPGSVYHVVRDEASHKMHALVPTDVWPLYKESLGCELYSGAEEATLPLREGAEFLLGELHGSRPASKALEQVGGARVRAEVVWSHVTIL